jgi:hypothetical protein
VQPVSVRILHPTAAPGSGELAALLAAARRRNADRLAKRFGRAGAGDVRIDGGPPDGRSYGERLRELAAGLAPGAGLVVLGSGAIPLSRRRDAADLLEAAGSGERRALANSFYSADVVAVGDAAILASVPDLPSDNALPRWLREQAGVRVEDLRRHWRLAIDLDSPLDAILVGRADDPDDGLGALVRDRIARIRGVVRDPASELVVAGRTSAATLRWLERRTASRTRALVEERGLRAIGLKVGGGPREGPRNRRQPRSALGLLLDERDPAELGTILAELGDAAVVDTRVLLAHRLGADEAVWPTPDDRYASDLLLADRIVDPWLRALTASARDAAIPILLGGHTLVGPGLRLVARGT